MVNILVLQDNRAGNNKQALSVAELIAREIPSNIEIKKVDYNSLNIVPNILGIMPKFYHIANKKEVLELKHKPDLIIAAGRKLASVALGIKNIYDCKWLQLMWPGSIAHHTDLLLIPKHDNLRNWFYKNKIIPTLGTPTIINDAKLKGEAAQFPNLNLIQKRKIAVLVGGKHKQGELTVEATRSLANMLDAINQDSKIHYLITTSRRTGTSQTSVLKQSICSDYELFEPNNNNILNPYNAYLYYADEIIVTTDSIAMLSEAITLNKPVYYFDAPQLSSPKHKRFYKELEDLELIKNIYNYGNQEFHPKINFNDLNIQIAQKIINRLALN
ncbi:ELM1/GtrOC1 family putative glycosyltransferase [Rickettsiales endosymbiont of Stachyamoeba lipophora]|uniref:ELM1/GtrOC1 family putative glycosyltransferase n=1 Tax=Rickettsiales endosymbiont of Stachyamoeba lipophora TaxID=2486578 RepID=UPI000F64C100|nr:ELM1/GtrOC1 family putative glycosyltransferase [Rickettsiales endosymbiont of Stachyamoeba lipophora]AZL15232.1 hypothetical protein EF513_01485 [Rickettsiales endosymbiont of Stachyamoeba lipophora]